MGKRVKRFLHSFFKIFIIFMLITLGVNLILFGILYINHKNKCSNEEAYMHAPGEYVEVDGKNIHIYESGNLESDIVVVFLHGGLNCDDSIAVQPLFDELNDYHLVYIDRSGYGFTQSSGSAKNTESIVGELRGTLEAADIEGPYYLIASQSAGVPAIYWADTYESEVAGIIGIDMNYPEQFEATTTEDYAGFFDYLMAKFCKIGGMRLVKNAYPTNYNDVYTAMQMKTRDALVSQAGYTDDMFLENEATVNNATETAELGWPGDTPILALVANPVMEPYVSDNESVKESLENAQKGNPDFDYESAYNESTKEYYAQYSNVEVQEFSGPSRLYTYCPKDVAEAVKEFIDNLDK